MNKPVKLINNSPLTVAASWRYIAYLSHPLHKPVQHPLLPRPIKVDRQLVAFDGRDVAVAELDVKDAVAEVEFRGGVDR